MKICTWNINSVRLRLPLVLNLMRDEMPDVIALQETKVIDALFPLDEFRKAGYEHVFCAGMKSYNGVAFISRHPIVDPVVHSRVSLNDCRHISATIKTIRFHNIYVPAGGDIPDPQLNPKFLHKLSFMRELASWFPDVHKRSDKMIALGDFNIAPGEHDVWSHKQLLNVVSHTPVEVEALQTFYNSMEWVDGVRHFIPDSQKCYSWWSYRNRDWRKSDRGRRLDHIWVSAPLRRSLSAHAILKEARDWQSPSDHVPVLLTLT